MSSMAWWESGGTTSIRGGRQHQVIVSTAAAPPTIRGSTASICRRFGAGARGAGGRSGFNAKFIIETGEEIGSPDLRQVCEQLREELAADLFVASDGPRLAADRPTIFLGFRGGMRILIDVEL